MSRIIRAADLFCGAGGTTAGLMQAAQGLGLEVRLVAVNHWARAMETFAHNHWFAGTKSDQVKQIGNSVPVRVAKALCASALAS